MRVAVALVLLLSAGGCFVGVSPFGALGRDRSLDETTVEGRGRAKILLLDVTGVIDDEPRRQVFGLIEEDGMLGRVQAALDKAADDDRVRALVLHIDSPGGGVTASDEIWTAIMRWKHERQVPVVAALGDVAASGGYYVACAADRIVAAPTTVTGSIGVILMNLDLEGLLGKIGVKNETYKAGAYKDMLSPLRGATPAERRIVQDVLDTLHQRFIAVVREGRPRLDPARLDEVTDGRIFDAPHALDVGLVDHVGSLRDAIDVAKAAAGVETARIVRYHRAGDTPQTIYSRLDAASTAPRQVNVLNVDLGILGHQGPRFMYLWAPGLVE